MLVLSRKRNERLRIRVPASAVDRDLWIMIVNVCGNNVRLGIDAGEDVKVLREELAQRITETGNAA